MTKEEYIKAYASRIAERSGLSEEDSLDIAEVGYDSFLEMNGADDMNDPQDDADTDMSYWDDDGE